jgi:hypothetical protein
MGMCKRPKNVTEYFRLQITSEYRSATGGKAAEESSFKKLGPRQWGAKAGVQKLGPDVVN